MVLIPGGTSGGGQDSAPPGGVGPGGKPRFGSDLPATATRPGNPYQNGSWSTNPKFDRRITNIPGAQDLVRGYMAPQFGVNGTRYGLNFLYNPSEVTQSHSLDQNSKDFQASTFQPKATGDNWVQPISSTVSFALLFDRSYELWDGSYKGTEAGISGCYADIAALLRMVQMETGSSAGFITSPMLFTPCFVYFGTPSSLKYYGSISDIQIAITHWNKKMVPARCTIGITMQLLPYGAGSDGAGTPAAPTPAQKKAQTKATEKHNADINNSFGPAL